MNRSFGYLLGLVLLLGLRPPQPKPNILLVIADDWSYPHAGALGDPVVRTPNLDRLIGEGVSFSQAFAAAPSCTPSRAALLTGQYPHRLEAGGNLWGNLPRKFPNYTELLERAGYLVGFERKGWGPGNFQAGGYGHNPAGKAYPSFEAFLKNRPDSAQPFCYWLGSQDPHRPYEKGTGLAAGLDPARVRVPAWLPDTPEVRADILDYYVEVERLDRDLRLAIRALEARGELKTTIIVVTSDNGMPFPRAKATLYDAGCRVPLVVWAPGSRVRAGQGIDELVSLTDLAPTFLQAAGLPVPAAMTGRSLWPVLRGARTVPRPQVLVERERHANVRRGDLSYPSRAIRTRDFLYIRNFEPDRWPAGDPTLYVAVGEFGDVDPSPSKTLILSDTVRFATHYRLAFAKRPAEELYDLKTDPDQVRNVADSVRFAAPLRRLRQQLNGVLKTTADPRATRPRDDRWDRYPYYGNPAATEKM